MLNFIKKLFGQTETAVEVQAEPAQPKALEFHEEIRAQVEANPFPVEKATKKPAVKKATTRKAPAKITAEKKPAKKKPAKKSK